MALVVDLEQREPSAIASRPARFDGGASMPLNVGPVDDPGHQHEGRIGPPVVRLDEHLERAQAVTVRMPGARRVEAVACFTFSVQERLVVAA